MNRLLSVLLVDRRGEEAEVQRRKGEYILSKGENIVSNRQSI